MNAPPGLETASDEALSSPSDPEDIVASTAAADDVAAGARPTLISPDILQYRRNCENLVDR
jgi:hypothetical protein